VTADAVADAFEALGHELRLRVVLELADDRRVAWQWRGRRFAELRKAVGVTDAGRFSYHLGELQPQFVVQQGDHYHLTPAGMAVAGAVLSGTYTGDLPSWRESTEYQCPDCGSDLTATFEHGYFRLACPEHGALSGITLPAGAVDGRSADDVLALAVHELNDYTERALHGECPHCRGSVETTLPSPDRPPARDGPPDPPPAEDTVLARFDCTRCGLTFWSTAAQCVRRHPAVAGFCWEHGIDTRKRPSEAFPFDVTAAATLERDEPVRVRVDLPLDDEMLRVRLDGDGAVVDVARQ
jgi:ribosomal protein S27AE